MRRRVFSMGSAGLLAACALLAAGRVDARPEFGVRAGLNLATMGGDGAEGWERSLRAGFGGGLFVRLPVGPHLALRPEVAYTQRGLDRRDRIPLAVPHAQVGNRTLGSMFMDVDERNRLTYLEFPVLLQWHPATGAAVKPHLFAGPNPALHLDATSEGTVTFDDGAGGTGSFDADITNVRTFDLGAVLGVGVEFPMGARARGGFEMRYGTSFTRAFHDVPVIRIFEDGVPFIEPNGTGLDLRHRFLSFAGSILF